MKDAITIGGLQCSAIINESSSITFDYFFEKMKYLENNEKRIVSFIDFGHASCNIIFSQFTNKTAKVLSVTSERFCGAREFDFLIAKKILSDYKNKFIYNPLEFTKAKVKLINYISKERKFLTVDKKISIDINNLFKGNDLKYNLSREEFEKIIDPSVKKFENLFKDAITQFEKITKYKLKDINNFEIVGKAMYTPIILKSLEGITQKKISNSLYSGECIAKGCAVYAVMSSIFYDIKNIKISNCEHYNPYAITMEFPMMKNNKMIIKQDEIIKKGVNLPCDKTITFTNDQLLNLDIITLKFFYSDNQMLKFLPNKLLNSYDISLKIKKEKEWKLIIRYKLDINCIPQLISAELRQNKIIKEGNKQKIIEVNDNLKVNQSNIVFGISSDVLEKYLNREKYEEKVIQKSRALKNIFDHHIFMSKEKLNEISKNFIINPENINNNSDDDVNNKLINTKKQFEDFITNETKRVKKSINELALDNLSNSGNKNNEIKVKENELNKTFNEINDLNKNKNKNKEQEFFDKIKEENINLKKELEQLRKINSKFPLNLLENEYILVLLVITQDENIIFSLICKNTDKFKKVENKFYENYPQYRSNKGQFIFKNNLLDKKKTLEECRLKNNDIITFRKS